MRAGALCEPASCRRPDRIAGARRGEWSVGRGGADCVRSGAGLTARRVLVHHAGCSTIGGEPGVGCRCVARRGTVGRRGSAVDAAPAPRTAQRPFSRRPFAWTTQRSSSRYGTRPARSATIAWRPCIIEGTRRAGARHWRRGCSRWPVAAAAGAPSAQAAIVVYDITSADTFARAKTWVKELQRHASPNIVIALAGNKADLSNKRAVEFEARMTGRPRWRRPCVRLTRCAGGTRIRRGQRLAVHGDICEDGDERERHLPGHWCDALGWRRARARSRRPRAQRKSCRRRIIVRRRARRAGLLSCGLTRRRPRRRAAVERAGAGREATLARSQSRCCACARVHVGAVAATVAMAMAVARPADAGGPVYARHGLGSVADGRAHGLAYGVPHAHGAVRPTHRVRRAGAVRIAPADAPGRTRAHTGTGSAAGL